MKFFVDQSLGGLIKWLRLVGYDARPIRLGPRQSASLPTPQAETYIVTRQSSWPQKFRRPDLVILEAASPEEQITEICRRLHLSSRSWQPLIRCSKCNHLLREIPPEQAEGRVPEFIFQTFHYFAECPRCQRVFWEGSHQSRIRHRLQTLEDQISTT